LGFRQEFTESLKILSKACDRMEERGLPRPVLVGGAAVELYTGSEITSGDFDVVTPAQAVFEEELAKLGFERPAGAGISTRGMVHPSLLIAVEVVSGTAFNGRMDQEHLTLVDTGRGRIAVVPLEDLIADRLGQFNSGPRGTPEMLAQAIHLFRFASEIDEAYLEKRIREETGGDYGLDFLKEQSADA